MPPSPGFRAPRAAFFAAACVLVSSGAHLYAGGAPIRLGVLAVAAALVFGGAYALAGRERTMAVLLPAAFGAQYGLHHLFSWGAQSQNADVGMAAAGHAHTSASTAMLLAHMITAVLTAAWLQRGETALCSLLRRLGAKAVPLLALLLPDPPVPPRPVQAPRRVAVPVIKVLRTAIARRGPPLSISS